MLHVSSVSRASASRRSPQPAGTARMARSRLPSRIQRVSARRRAPRSACSTPRSCARSSSMAGFPGLLASIGQPQAFANDFARRLISPGGDARFRRTLRASGVSDTFRLTRIGILHGMLITRAARRRTRLFREVENKLASRSSAHADAAHCLGLLTKSNWPARRSRPSRVALRG
jgi:hypothetical protein